MSPVSTRRQSMHKKKQHDTSPARTLNDCQQIGRYSDDGCIAMENRTHPQFPSSSIPHDTPSQRQTGFITLTSLDLSGLTCFLEINHSLPHVGTQLFDGLRITDQTRPVVGNRRQDGPFIDRKDPASVWSYIITSIQTDINFLALRCSAMEQINYIAESLRLLALDVYVDRKE